MPEGYEGFYIIMDASMETGLSYKEAFSMPLDELELYVYLCAARSYRINDSVK